MGPGKVPACLMPIYSLTIMYKDLVLGVYSKALLQDSCSHQWALGKFPHALCRSTQAQLGHQSLYCWQSHSQSTQSTQAQAQLLSLQQQLLAQPSSSPVLPSSWFHHRGHHHHHHHHHGHHHRLQSLLLLCPQQSLCHESLQCRRHQICSPGTALRDRAIERAKG